MQLEAECARQSDFLAVAKVRRFQKSGGRNDKLQIPVQSRFNVDMRTNGRAKLVLTAKRFDELVA